MNPEHLPGALDAMQSIRRDFEATGGQLDGIQGRAFPKRHICSAGVDVSKYG